MRSRIVGHEEVAPDQLLANPLNFRRHPGPQLEALRGSMAELGWVKTVIVNRRTGYVLDGHARIEEALRQGLKTVPVTYVDLSEAEERVALASLDPITEMAQRDEVALRSLLDSIQVEDARLRSMLDGMNGVVPEGTMPDLPEGGRLALQERTFILHDQQVEQVERALQAAGKLGPYDESLNSNRNGNALARICEAFLTQHGDG